MWSRQTENSFCAALYLKRNMHLEKTHSRPENGRDAVARRYPKENGCDDALIKKDELRER